MLCVHCTRECNIIFIEDKILEYCEVKLLQGEIKCQLKETPTVKQALEYLRPKHGE